MPTNIRSLLTAIAESVADGGLHRLTRLAPIGAATNLHRLTIAFPFEEPEDRDALLSSDFSVAPQEARLLAIASRLGIFSFEPGSYHMGRDFHAWSYLVRIPTKAPPTRRFTPEPSRRRPTDQTNG